MANKRIRTTPSYLEYAATTGGQTYTVTGTGVVVDEGLVTAIVAAGTTLGVSTIVTDSTAPTTPPDPSAEQDTDWIDFADVPEFQGQISLHGAAFLRRRGNRVAMSFNPGAEGSGIVVGSHGLQLPDGYRPFDGNTPQTARVIGVITTDDGTPDAVMSVTSDGVINVGTFFLNQAVMSDYSTGILEFTTFQAFPS